MEPFEMSKESSFLGNSAVFSHSKEDGGRGGKSVGKESSKIMEIQDNLVIISFQLPPQKFHQGW